MKQILYLGHGIVLETTFYQLNLNLSVTLFLFFFFLLSVALFTSILQEVNWSTGKKKSKQYIPGFSHLAESEMLKRLKRALATVTIVRLSVQSDFSDIIHKQSPCTLYSFVVVRLQCRKTG